MFDHSEECTASLAELQSSHAALAMGSSWSPFRFPLRMSDKIFCSMPVSSTPSRACTAITPQVNFPRKITFDTLYTNEFVIRVRSRALAILSERTTI